MTTSLRLTLGPDQTITITHKGARAQPEPRTTKVVTSPNGDFTCIQRRWWPGDSARCQLCPSGRCVVDEGDVCCFGVRGSVTVAEARLFDANGLVWAEPG